MLRKIWKILCVFLLLLAFALLFSACEREIAEDGGELVYVPAPAVCTVIF